ncbi:MAG: AMIN domain-containing protein [bacterium]
MKLGSTFINFKRLKGDEKIKREIYTTKLFYLLFLILILTTSISYASPHCAKKIISINPQTEIDAVKVCITADGKISDYNTYLLAKPYRLVIDLPNIRTSMLKKTWLIENPLVNKIRLGTDYRDKTRVVFDLSTEEEPLYKVTNQGDYLLVSFMKGSAFQASESTHQASSALSPSKVISFVSYERKNNSWEKVREITSPEKIIEITENANLGTAGTITSLELANDSQNAEVHIIADGRLIRYDTLYLTNPSRLVVDLFDVKAPMGDKTWEFKGPLLKQVRLGTYYDKKVRVVFDLKTGSDVPYEVRAEGERLIISLL